MMARYTIVRLMLALAIAIPCGLSSAEVPTVTEILEAFQARATATGYISYRAEGSATIPAYSHMGVDTETYMSTGVFYPDLEENFNWSADAQFDIHGNRGIYEDQCRLFSQGPKSTQPHHERVFIRGLTADVEYLLPPSPQSATESPQPDIRFELNQKRTFRGAGFYYVPEAILTAFGYFPHDDGEFSPISEPSWAPSVNAMVLPSEASDKVTLKYTDESWPGTVTVFSLLCEAAQPHRLLELNIGTNALAIHHVQLTYRGAGTDLAAIHVESSDPESNRTVFRGSATLTRFESALSPPAFEAQAYPENGVWVRDSPSLRVYRFQRPGEWHVSRWLVLGLPALGMLVAVYLFKRSIGSAVGTTR